MGPRRLAQNEDLFRQANEAIEEVARAFQDDDAHLFAFFCECSDAGCGELVQLSVREYEHVRSQPAWFFVLAGHEQPEIERVLERHLRYLVVEKLGEAGEVARARDPRAA